MSKNLKFGIAFFITLLSTIPLMHGDLMEWVWIVAGILWALLLCWVIVSEERKPLIWGVISAMIIGNLVSYLLKHL